VWIKTMMMMSMAATQKMAVPMSMTRMAVLEMATSSAIVTQVHLFSIAIRLAP
jgi:hypothetical protein